MSFRELAEYTFPVHTDAVEFAPDLKHLACGAYELNEITREVNGCFALFEINGEVINKTEEHVTPGVLDLSWLSNEVSVGALSTGELCFFKLNSVDLQTITLSSSSILLSVDVLRSNVVASAANGHLFLCDANSSRITASWKGHDYESWCVSFHKMNENIIFSGGDDNMARVWDLRYGLTRSVFSKRHEMGVCSVSSAPANQHLLSTGCFDEHLRVWDLRFPNNAAFELIHTERGGVWRHKWASSLVGPSHLLIAAMHAGFAVATLNANLNEPCISVVNEAARDFKPCITYYRQSAKLGYGIDWALLPASVFKALIATCSFYDNHVTFAVYEDQ